MAPLLRAICAAVVPLPYRFDASPFPFVVAFAPVEVHPVLVTVQWVSWAVAFVGLTPVAQKTFNNYTLEITDAQHHPRYLSTLSLSMALPIFASPLVSPLINAVGFEVIRKRLLDIEQHAVDARLLDQ